MHGKDSESLKSYRTILSPIRESNQNKVALIAHHVPNIAVTNYSVSIYKACSDIVYFYTLITRKKLYKAGSIESVPIRGLFPYVGGKFNLNRTFPKFAFHHFYRKFEYNPEIKKIHYAAQYIAPLDNSLDNIVTVHDIMPLTGTSKVKPWELRFLKKTIRVYSKFTYVLADTDYVKKQLSDYGFDGNIKVIPYPLSDSFYPLGNKNSIREELNLPIQKHLILSVSGFNKNKNISLIKKLTNLLPDTYKIIRVGGALKGCINFSNVDGTTLNKIYNASDLLIQPSIDEGFGGPVIEAMATNLPLVISDIEPFREITLGHAFFANPYEPNSFVESIKEAIGSTEKFLTKNLERSEYFNSENFRLKIRAYYDSILC